MYGKRMVVFVTTISWKRSAVSTDIGPVVKVRGNAGERRSWAPKIAGERSQAPHSRYWYERVERARSAYSRAPNFFQSSWAPNLYFNHCIGPYSMYRAMYMCCVVR